MMNSVEKTEIAQEALIAKRIDACYGLLNNFRQSLCSIIIQDVDAFERAVSALEAEQNLSERAKSQAALFRKIYTQRNNGEVVYASCKIKVTTSMPSSNSIAEHKGKFGIELKSALQTSPARSQSRISSRTGPRNHVQYSFRAKKARSRKDTLLANGTLKEWVKEDSNTNDPQLAAPWEEASNKVQSVSDVNQPILSNEQKNELLEECWKLFNEITYTVNNRPFIHVYADEVTKIITRMADVILYAELTTEEREELQRMRILIQAPRRKDNKSEQRDTAQRMASVAKRRIPSTIVSLTAQEILNKCKKSLDSIFGND